MNNKINKYRIWSKLINKWVTDLDVDLLCHPFRDTINDVFANDNLVFQQYTGLNDKNGREIYEGDIVYGEVDFREIDDMGMSYGDKYTFKGEIIFKNCMFMCAEADFMFGDYTSLEVMGNILENKEKE